MRNSLTRLALVLAAGTAIAGCSLAPDYSVPKMSDTPAYKEAASARPQADIGTWTAARPADTAQRGAWWTVFGDPGLDRLEERAFAANQDIAAAAARYREARATADAAGAQLFPALSVGASGVRERISPNVLANHTGAAEVGGDYVLRAQMSYELDFWGRVRNTAAAARGRVQASIADLDTALLSIQSELASDYLELRGMDAQIDLLTATVDAYAKALRITQDRHEGGAAAIVDVEQATTQLENAKVQLADTRLSRAQMEHAVAILVGAVPSTFDLAPDPLHLTPPTVTVGLPSHLLERRPDVASAERQVFAANAEIGVARAAWFPTFSLDAGIGFESSRTNNWLDAPSRIWSVGPSTVLTVFDWGLRRAQNDQAIAAYDENVAKYREAVLGAYRQVEDQLAAIRWLDTQLVDEDRAVASSQAALDQSNYRYKGGIATYLEVATAQNTALEAQRAALNLRVRRLDASLQLIKALGGGWSDDDLKQPPTLPAVIGEAAP